MKLLFAIFDFILPRFCPACQKKLSLIEKLICEDCRNTFVSTDEQLLQFEYERKFSESKVISDFYPLLVFVKDSPLQQVIHQIKYQKKFLLAVELGKMLGNSLLKNKPGWKVDIILPVPLHSLKKAERGFNQSFYIAKGISKVTKFQVSHSIIKRKRYTESQTKKNLNERAENMSEAFIVKHADKIGGKNILLVDDVITTGATIRECGKKLQEYGAANIYAASIALAE
ncbi:MAG: ComF family protein [Ignavibacteriaceae bacterium]|nr:ComF family protein [Ignavibacteriaceae bacterium]